MNRLEIAVKKLSFSIRYYRNLKNLSQLEMSELLDVSTRNFQRLEKGEKIPTLETLVKICKILDISLENLFDESHPTHFDITQFLTQRETHEAKLDGVLEKVLTGQESELIKQILTNNVTHLTDLKSVENRFEVIDDKAYSNDNFANKLGLSAGVITLDHHLISSRISEIWEVIHRQNLKQMIRQQSFIFPVGVRTILNFHTEIKTTDTSFRSRGFCIDITDRVSLEQCLIKSLAKPKIAG